MTNVEARKDCGLDGLTFKGPSICKMEFAADCDIHVIVKRFLRTGVLPETRPVSSNIDVTTLPEDFVSLQNGIVSLRQRFDQLPLDERNRFNNDPIAWLDSLQATPEDVVKDSPPSQSSDLPASDPDQSPSPETSA